MRVCTLTMTFVSLLTAGQLAAQPATDNSAPVAAVVEEFHRAIASGDQAVVTRLMAEALGLI